MKQVKNKGSKIEIILMKELWSRGLCYRKNFNGICGKPDIVFIDVKAAVFCDSKFRHGFNWEERKHDFISHQEFWIPKIKRKMERDREVTAQLQSEDRAVLRFWGNEIKKDLKECANKIKGAVRK